MYRDGVAGFLANDFANIGFDGQHLEPISHRHERAFEWFAINGASANSTGPGSMFQVRPDPATCDWHRASTPSGDAILVALCDGSARSLRASTAPGVWWSALQPNDGGILGNW